MPAVCSLSIPLLSSPLPLQPRQEHREPSRALGLVPSGTHGSCPTGCLGCCPACHVLLRRKKCAQRREKRDNPLPLKSHPNSPFGNFSADPSTRLHLVSKIATPWGPSLQAHFSTGTTSAGKFQVLLRKRLREQKSPSPFERLNISHSPPCCSRDLQCDGITSVRDVLLAASRKTCPLLGSE